MPGMEDNREERGGVVDGRLLLLPEIGRAHV